MWAGFDAEERRTLERDGASRIAVRLRSDEPYPDHQTVDRGWTRQRLVLRDPLPLPFPVRLLHGTADADVLDRRWRCGCSTMPRATTSG
jgi:hypothetical protein